MILDVQIEPEHAGKVVLTIWSARGDRGAHRATRVVPAGFAYSDYGDCLEGEAVNGSRTALALLLLKRSRRDTVTPSEPAGGR